VLFNSYVFIFVFMPIALVGYFMMGRIGKRAAGAWLGMSSLVFYAWWSPPFLLLLIGSISFNYLISLQITQNQGRTGRLNTILTVGIAGNLLALFYYKYLFTLVGFLDSLGVMHLSMNPIILPLGISFYTFTQIGYLVDCRQGMAKEKGLLEYVLFVTFFPHLIAGPILHHKEIMPQFAKPETYRFNKQNLAIGLTIFIIGLTKKVVVADSMIQVVSTGFGNADALGMRASWLTALSYSLQLYFDFSGYSDMAIGLAYMFNVRFPLNFNSPYKARSIIDFWQRWHMTLTRYLTLYLYNPMAMHNMRRRMAKGLTISDKGARTPTGFLTMIAIPIFITMTLAGVWHGAGSQFLIFGLLHSSYLVVNHVWRTFRPSRHLVPDTPIANAATAAFQVLLTYLAVLVAEVFFRAPSTGHAIALLSGMVGLNGISNGAWWSLEFGPFYATVAKLALLFAIVWAMPNTQEIMEKFPAALGRIQANRFKILLWQPTMRWAVASGLAASLCILGLSRHTEFLYFQF
jgi:alginate O-acetyltransferase complex protein AlgI